MSNSSKVVIATVVGFVVLVALGVVITAGFNTELQASADNSALSKAMENKSKPPAKITKKWTRDNSSYLVEEEFFIDVEPVRELKPRPGYYVYETDLERLADGVMYERWVYNVTKTDNSYSIVRTLYSFLFIDGRWINGSAIMEWLVVNNTVIWLHTITGESLWIHNYTERPISMNCLPLLVAPPFWPYVAEGRQFRVKWVNNVTYLPQMTNGPTIVSRAEFRDEYKVAKELVDCRGPVGKCYVVEAELKRKYYSNYTKITNEFEPHRYVFYVDLSGVVVEVREYVGKSKIPTLTVKLVEWT
ncbi:MAG: hypothetical protein ACPL3C_05590 [Pyrobaculum sp.]